MAAIAALGSRNTSSFNKKYGTTANSMHLAKRRPSQFEAAQIAIRSRSPILFNQAYANNVTTGGKTRKNSKGRKARKASRRRPRKN